MDAVRAAIVTEARTWLGTDFHHQARIKKTGPKDRGGVDCLGLVWAVGEACKVMPPVTDAQARPFWRFYGRRPNPPVMRDCLSRFLVEIPEAEARPGDLSWTHWGNEMPIHMAIFAEFKGRRTVIHSMWDTGVVEHTMVEGFRERITAYWRYPALVEAA